MVTSLPLEAFGKNNMRAVQLDFKFLYNVKCNFTLRQAEAMMPRPVVLGLVIF